MCEGKGIRQVVFIRSGTSRAWTSQGDPRSEVIGRFPSFKASDKWSTWLHISLSTLLEECPYDKNLESTQRNYENTLNDGKPNDSRLGWPHSRKVSILTRPKILLCTRYVRIGASMMIQIVDSWPDNLRNVTSRFSDSSLDADFMGNCARGSCSTYHQSSTLEVEQ